MRIVGRLHFDPRQQRIHERLCLIGDGPAAFYRDALRMLDEASTIESGAHMLAHCAREIEGALRQVLLPLAPAVDTDVPKNKKGKEETHAEQVARIVDAYGIPPDSSAARIWSRIADEGQLHKLAHRDALMRPRALDSAYRDFWREWEEVLDAVLDRFEARFGEHVLLLQSLALVKVPDAGHLKRLRNTVPNNHMSLSEFFSRIDGRWLPLLHQGRFFANPPGPDVTRDGDHYPPWAASQLLARLAEGADASTRTLVEKIALEVPETPNPSVVADLAAVACRADPAVAVQLAGRLAPHLRGRHAFRLPGLLADLALRLVAQGRDDAAVGIMRELVTVEPSTGALTVDAFELEHAVPRLTPPLFRVRPLEVIAALCDNLDPMLRVLLRSHDGVFVDDGAAFRPAIESSGQNNPNTEREAAILIDALRDGCALIIGERADLAPAILGELLRRDLLIFKRIAMHLLARFPGPAPEPLEELLLDRSGLESIPLWHERRELERAGFRHLSPDARRRFLKQIDSGPDLESFRRWSEAPPSEESVREYVRRWRREHLALIADDLPPDVRADFDAIVAEHGPASHPAFLSPIGAVWTGPTSPRGQAELAAMTPADVIAWLKEWTPPPSRFDGPFASREGLLRELKKVIAAQPEPWARDALDFSGLHPTYVRALLEGVTDSIARSSSFPWEPVFELCEGAVCQPVDDAVGVRAAIDRGEDPGWRWARRAISDLLMAGVKDGVSSIPDALLSRVVPLLRELRATPEPRVGLREPMDEGLNTIAGSTTQGVILYALRRVAAARRDDSTAGFDAAPDARAMLESCLATTAEPHLGSRAIIGAYLSQLVAVDHGWVHERRDQLFPPGDAGKALRDAVWDSYLRHGEATRLAFETLREPFEARVAEVAAEGKEQRVTALLNHLVPLYWSGLVPLNEPGPLREFYQAASPASRAALLKHVGFSVFHTKEAIDGGLLARSQALWEQRVVALAKGDPSAAAIEAAPFGWWFSSGKFDRDWSLAELRRALSFTTRLDLNFAVAERLAVAATTRPQDAIELLTMLVSADDGAHVGSCRKGIRDTVVAARSSQNQAAAQVARELVSRLVARGYQDFIDLL
jgi:hypothetical protein